MCVFSRAALNILAAGFCLVLCGCDPAQNTADDKNEPHYILGENRFNAMDFQGAAEAFEQSLEVNPHSAPAHYQLGMLFDVEGKMPDPAAAIYHYQEFLKLNPAAQNADVIRGRISVNKQGLAADVMAMPSAPAAQQELVKLSDQNRQLQDQIDTLKKWNAYYAAQLAAFSNSIPAQNNSGAQQGANPVPQQQTIPMQMQNPIATHPTISSAPKTHAVASGETEAAIARKYGIKLSALQAANPGVNPNKLRVGQPLKYSVAMIPRIAFFFIVAFWVTMNILLWRAEYGSRGGEVSVPLDLVWRKILTAPDISSLTIYQDRQRLGFCEFSTSVWQEMAKLDENSPPSEGISIGSGYQIRLNGSAIIGDFTNRVKFDGRLSFSSIHDWRELNLKVSTREVAVTIHSISTNRMVTLAISEDGSTELHEFNFASLQNPNTLLRTFAGNSGGGFFGGFDLPELPQTSALAQNLHWQASRERLMLGHEPVSVYRLETQVLGNPVVIYVSTIGEILRVELPGNITASLDVWGKSSN